MTSDNFLDVWKMRRRAKRDSARHARRVKKAIKENLRDLISESNIISSDGKKKIKIPIRYLDLYRFKHGKNPNREHVGQGNKDNKPGDIIARDDSGEDGNKAGDQPGEEIYEEEISVEELINMMLEDLGLPWMEKKDSVVEVETEDLEFTDLSEVGALSNVDKKRTIYENMKRNAKMGKPQIRKIAPEDLRYKVWEVQKEYHSNAAVYFLMDRSGSMDEDKKYIAKSFFWYLYHFCKTKYNNVEVVFVAHDTTAKIVSEEDFFRISNSGGTKCSSAFQLALNNIAKYHPKEKYNTYVFAFSDGDNWGDDNKVCVDLVNELLEVCTAVGYGEIDTDNIFGKGGLFSWSTLHDEFAKSIKHERFLTASISKKEDVYDCLKQFLGI